MTPIDENSEQTRASHFGKKQSLDQFLSSHYEMTWTKNFLSTNQAEVVVLQKSMNDESAQFKEMALAILDARDYAIGASAELGELRFRHDEAVREIDSLVHQLNLLHGSRTWKIGRFVLLPLRVVRKALRLVMN